MFSKFFNIGHNFTSFQGDYNTGEGDAEVIQMKEIKFAGKLECNFNTQLKRHMDNVGSKLNDLVDAINSARKDGYNIKVDISKLEKEEVKNEKRSSKSKGKSKLY